jgi:quinol monooxygenase YgiN
MSTPVTSLAHYRVKPGCEEQFLEIIDRHTATLRELELVTDRETEVYLGAERGVEGPFIIEVFDWVDEDAAARAHTHPHVSAVWESMGPLCEERGGRPMFEFPTLRRLHRG